MKPFGRFCVLATLLLCIAPLCGAQQPPQSQQKQQTSSQKVTLAIRAKAGQIARYQQEADLKVSAEGMSLALQIKQTQRVKFTNVAPSGDVTLEQTTESGEISTNGHSSPLPDEEKTTDVLVVHPDGTLASYKSAEGEAQARDSVRLIEATSVVFPQQPVGVGDSWSYTYQPNDKLGIRTGKADFKIDGEETVASADTFRVELSFTETFGEHPITAKGTLWVEKSSGDTVKSDLQVDNVPFGGPDAPTLASGHFTSQRTEGSPLGDVKTGGVASASEAPKPKTIDDEVKGFEKLPGFVTIYRKKTDEGDTIYMEIPEDLLNKPLFMEVTARTGTSAQIVAGTPINDLLFKFVKTPDGKLTIVVPNINFRVRPDTPLARAVKRSFADAELESFVIKAQQPDRKSLLIDVSDLFKGDIAQVTDIFSNPLGGLFGGGGGGYALDRSKTYVTSIKNFPKDLVVETHYNFMKLGRGGGTSLTELLGGFNSVLADDRSIPFIVNYTLFPLPTDNGYMPRLADPRIGYFQVEFQDLDDDSKADQSVHYIYRWHLVKANPNAPLSEPVKPIVIWLDNAIPLQYREAIKEGILYWNRAFEKIGFKNAIVVQQMPDNADWDTADMRYNVVRWVTSPSSGYAVSLMRVNPLTGQILNADITIDANLVRFTKVEQQVEVDPASYFNEMMQPLSPKELLKRSLQEMRCDMPAEGVQNAWFGSMALKLLEPAGLVKTDETAYANDFLRSVVAHEMGHILGLRHNFVASTYHTLDQLKDEQTIDKTGISASVMDYLPFNIAALRRRGVAFWTPRIGPYDEWAIKYGYLPIPNAKTPEAELYTLHRIASACNLPGHAYESDEIADQFDPDVTRFDLGAAPLVYWKRSLDLSRYLLLTLSKRVPAPGQSYWEFTRDFNGLLNIHVASAARAAHYIGGLYVNRNQRGDYLEHPTLLPIPRAQQEAALQLICNYMLSADAFNFPSSYYTHFTTNPNAGFVVMLQRQDYPIFDTISSAQESCLRYLFSSITLDRIVNNEFKVGPTKTLPLTELFHMVNAAVWPELASGANINALHRELQRTYIDIMADMVVTPTNPAPADAKMLAWYQMRTLRDEIEADLKRPHDEYTRIHLSDCLMRINRALHAQQIIGGPQGGAANSLLQLLLGDQRQK